MARFTKLSGKRHRIVIAGLVLDGGTGRAVAGATLQLTAMPESLAKRLSLKALQHGARWATLTCRPDRALSGHDGSFCFLDLPAGVYAVTATLPDAGTRYGTATAEITVPAWESSSTGEAATASEETPAALPSLLQLRLPPTSLQGVVQAQLETEAEPVTLARLQIKGSGETATSDSEGAFALSGLEPGNRTLLVSARGYQAASLQVQLEQGSVTNLSVTLEPLSGL